MPPPTISRSASETTLPVASKGKEVTEGNQWFPSVRSPAEAAAEWQPRSELEARVATLAPLAQFLYCRELRHGGGELGLRLRHLELARAIPERLFGFALRFERFRFVEIVPADRGVGKDSDDLGL